MMNQEMFEELGEEEILLINGGSELTEAIWFGIGFIAGAYYKGASTPGVMESLH